MSDQSVLTASPFRDPKGADRPPMRVVFAGGNGYPPEASGGVQSSTHDLACRLLTQGHHPSVLAPLYGTGWFGLRARARLKLNGAGVVRDLICGYPVYRAWFPERAVAACMPRARPDVAVVQCHGTVPIAREFQKRGVPLVIYLRNVEFDQLGGDLRDLHGVTYIANSCFTAATYKARFGIAATVIPPTVNAARYEVVPDGDCVTFVNPVPEKGLARAIEIAALCPDIPFLFVESWQLSPTALADLQRAIRPYPNIRFEHRTDDMKSIYRQSRVVLAPSKWEEAWGRVASEAHCSGIPVVGSTRGGLPEAIGPGGTLLDYDAALADWVVAVRNFWSDPAEHGRASKAARTYSRRTELDPEEQFRTFMSVLDAAVMQPSAP